jgi:hypothetical protein
MGKLIDLTGEVFGRLTVIESAGKNKHGSYRWKCHCICGKEKVIDGSALRQKLTTSCGCYNLEQMHLRDKNILGQTINNFKIIEKEIRRIKGTSYIFYKTICLSCGKEKWSKRNSVVTYKCNCSRAENLVGKIFGKLTVIKKYGRNKKDKLLWECKCECGKIHHATTAHLMNGTSSCGCKSHGVKQVDRLKIRLNRLFNEYVNSAKKRNIVFDIPRNEFDIIVQKPCQYCGNIDTKHYMSNPKTKEKEFFKLNGIDRIDSSNGYIKENIVSCCRTCNMAKMVMLKEEFLLWVERVYNHSIKDKEK